MHSHENEHHPFIVGGLLYSQDYPKSEPTEVDPDETASVGRMLMFQSDYLSDHFWEHQGGDPDRIPNATEETTVAFGPLNHHPSLHSGHVG